LNSEHRLIPRPDDNIVLEETDFDKKYYHQYFVGREHDNFIAEDEKVGPVAISVIREENQMRALVRTKQIDSPPMRVLPLSDVKLGMFKTKAHRSMLKALVPELHLRSVRLVKDERLISSLSRLELGESSERFKIGVLYVKEGQTQEEDMFANSEGSESFNDFLNLLGQKVPLKGWSGFSGGLDVQNNSTGTHMYCTRWNDFEIVFHVSTLLPYNKDDKQQLERKRHIGNDIVVIVFLEGHNPKYFPDTIKSHFNHVICAVSVDREPNRRAQNLKIKRPTRYKIQLARKDGVSPFSPQIPSPPIFESGNAFRDFLLTKLVNGERKAYKAPEFHFKLQRTRGELLTSYSQAY